MSENCIFCKIANGEIPTEFVYESENVVVFKDINPQAPTHLLVVPKVHIPSLAQLNDKNLMSELLSGVIEATKKLNITDYRTVINTGSKAGQEVFHIHIHVMAGREFSWPAG